MNQPALYDMGSALLWPNLRFRPCQLLQILLILQQLLVHGCDASGMPKPALILLCTNLRQQKLCQGHFPACQLTFAVALWEQWQACG